MDVGFWGGIIPGNEKELPKLIEEGVVGFKCFLCPSGVDEFPNVTEEDVELAYKQLVGMNGLIAVGFTYFQFSFDSIFVHGEIENNFFFIVSR